ncbi:hypothetical protein [Pseudovibrio ascidiaceicola]|uniref:hypothetical protein n=1 Tax=Pseudovibrio ascidiaceicola TaxID=285279 RepID=UPI001358DAE2|nr:hypothetical protein [Pseudovibrio ascidiaceicola]
MTGTDKGGGAGNDGFYLRDCLSFAVLENGRHCRFCSYWSFASRGWLLVAHAYILHWNCCGIFELKAAFSDATAGVLAMSGRNITVFVLRLSRDPFKSAGMILKIWKGYR